MDSEMYSDFTGPHKYSDGHHSSVENEQLLKKKDSTWHKNVAESLGKLYDKVTEVDATVGKRLDALAASISESKIASEKQPDLEAGSELQGIAVAEVNQLLSDVESLKNDLTGTEKGIVQSGGGYPVDVDSRLVAMQVQIDVLKGDIKLVSENLASLISYFKARGTNKPLSIKGGMQDGKLVIHAVERG